MTWPEVEEILKQDPFVLIPVGTTEGHGPHLPLGTDSFIAYEIAKGAAQKAIEMGVKTIVAPPVLVGYSMENMSFPGSISLSGETVGNVVLDVCRSLIRHGFKNIIIVNGHGGHVSVLDVVSRKIRDETDGKIIIAMAMPQQLVTDVIERLMENNDGHAGESETSLIMAFRPELVRKEKMMPLQRKDVPIVTKIEPIVSKEEAEERTRYNVTIPMPFLATLADGTGITGDPTKATPEKGKKIAEAAITRLAAYMEEVKKKKKIFGLEL